jgi:uncharacterized protein YbcC (UPF0753/DUF2309 family)
METQKQLTTCEGECEEKFIKSELKEIADEGKIKLVCKFCYQFIKAEQESEDEYNYVMSGNVYHKRT